MRVGSRELSAGTLAAARPVATPTAATPANKDHPPNRTSLLYLSPLLIPKTSLFGSRKQLRSCPLRSAAVDPVVVSAMYGHWTKRLDLPFLFLGSEPPKGHRLYSKSGLGYRDSKSHRRSPWPNLAGASMEHEDGALLEDKDPGAELVVREIWAPWGAASLTHRAKSVHLVGAAIGLLLGYRF
ncbi:hypothetical protein GQ457_12G007860 [Hibiscus cannabinus]